MARHGAVRGDLPASRVRELGFDHQPHANHRLHPAGRARPPRLGLHRCGDGRDSPRPLPVGPCPRQDLAWWRAAMTFTPEVILSLIATAGVGIAFLLMLQESIALRRGSDPITNGVRALVRRYPRVTLTTTDLTPTPSNYVINFTDGNAYSIGVSL